MLNIPISNTQNYYYLQLSPQLQAVYEQCVDHLRRGELNVTVDASMGNREEALNLILEALDYGCPELFFLDKGVRSITTGNSVRLTFTSKYPQSSLSTMWDELNAEVETVVREIGMFYSDEEKISGLNAYLCNNIQTCGSEEGRYGDAYGALINKEARCEGVCKAAQLILNRLNIKNVITYGVARRDGEQENHAWSIIWVEGEPYAFDFTWNIATTMLGVVSMDYMFLAEEDIALEHFPNKNCAYPVTEFSSLTYWQRENTEVTYREDFCNVSFMDAGNNCYAIVRLMLKPTREEVDEEVYDWYISEMGGNTMYGDFCYRYNEALGILTVYIVVDDM